MRLTTRLVMLATLCAPLALHAAGRSAGSAADANNRLNSGLGFIVDYPKKDWKPVVGAGSSLVVFVHKSGQATVAIEKSRVTHPLAPDEITEQTATLEIEDWQARNPTASGFAHQFADLGGRAIVIDFTQPGAQGRERVRMYTLPRGTDWYRLICTATASSFDNVRDTCQRMVQSLTVTPSPTR